MPAKNDPPLNLTAPKPSFATAKTSSAFGFQPAATPEVDQDSHESQAGNMGVDMDVGEDFGEDLYASDRDGMDGMNQGDRHNSGMIYFLSFNTLTFFARTQELH